MNILKSITPLAIAAAIGGFGYLAAAQVPDGVRIVNSGSTNVPGWSLLARTDGSGDYTFTGRAPTGAAPSRAPTKTTIDANLVQNLIAAAKAARDAGAAGGSCMKSASFGSRTVVSYHGWSSPDLQCPPSSGLLITLAAAVRQVQQAAGITNTPRRVGLPPNEMRRAPEATPRPAAP